MPDINRWIVTGETAPTQFGTFGRVGFEIVDAMVLCMNSNGVILVEHKGLIGAGHKVQPKDNAHNEEVEIMVTHGGKLCDAERFYGSTTMFFKALGFPNFDMTEFNIEQLPKHS